jgi:hypothetical protein
MYLPSNTPLLQGQREHAACEEGKSRQRIAATRRQVACSRASLFSTLMSPEQALESFGIGAAVNVAKLQRHSRDARAAVLAGTGGPVTTARPGQTSTGIVRASSGPSLADYIRDAPTVVSLNAQADQTGCSRVRFSQSPLPPDPSPSMPEQGPSIVETDHGPMYFRGAPGTGTLAPSATLGTQYLSIVPNEPSRGGLTGYSPAWSDAWAMEVQQAVKGPDTDVGFMDWVSEHPWLSLAIVAGGVAVLSRRTKR